MVKEILFIIWLFLVAGAFITTLRIKNLTYGTKKYDINLWLSAAFNILALTTMVIRAVIN